MADKLLSFYKQANDMGGAKARMRLAVITRISGNQAGEVPDSSENMIKFEAAMKELEKEFK